MRLLFALLICLPLPSIAETLVATQTIRSHTLLMPEHLGVSAATVPGALSHPDQAIGQEARVILYAGRPIRPGDIGPAAIIERNQIVTLRYRSHALSIATEARALGRAGPGDVLRVMNLASRTTVSGVVSPQGDVIVGAPN